MRCYVLMGVSGCGKTSVGRALASRCEMTFIDGDDLHPQANIDKMASGQPLTDGDRLPWLQGVGDRLALTTGRVAIGCSALKRRYRDIIRSRVSEPVGFVHLDAAQSVLAVRVGARAEHFMPPALLQSQFDALEGLQQDELGLRVDIDQAFDEVVAQAEIYLKETMT